MTDTLKALSRQWDDDKAQDLYWGELHHQDDLYPVTFAALPWIWRVAPRALERSGETLLFLSHVLDCALRPGGTGCDGTGPRGRHRGLSTAPADHQWDWLSPEQRLGPEDGPVLERLEAWFRHAAPEIAEACLDGISGNDRFTDANLLRGPAALANGGSLSFACTLWGDKHDVQTILEDAPSGIETERSAAMCLAERIASCNSDLARFLRAWAAA